jgi:hypothetical protein
VKFNVRDDALVIQGTTFQKNKNIFVTKNISVERRCKAKHKKNVYGKHKSMS